MTKEIIDQDTPHADIGKQKFRVKKFYTAWVEYEVVADSKEEADDVVSELGGISRVKWNEDEYHNDAPIEVVGEDSDVDHRVQGSYVRKVAECVPYEDGSAIDYSDADWTTNEMEWTKTGDEGASEEYKIKKDQEVPF